jgi:hypothetical protein
MRIGFAGQHGRGVLVAVDHLGFAQPHPGTGLLARNRVEIDPGSSKSIVISFRRADGVERASTGNMRRIGARKPMVSTCRLAVRALPVRR